MKMEDHFKETLNNAVANEPPVRDAWNTFERRVRVDRRRRIVGLVAAAAVIAGVAWIVYPIAGAKNGRPIVPATQLPAQTPTAPPRPPYAQPDWVRYKNDLLLYSIDHPKSWRGPATFEGVDSFQPNGAQPLEKGTPTFAITIQFQQGADPAAAPSGEPTPSSSRTVEGSGSITGTRYEYESGQGRTILYRFDWTACAAGVTPCQATSGTLEMRIIASTDTLWKHYGGTAEKIVRTLEQWYWSQ